MLSVSKRLLTDLWAAGKSVEQCCQFKFTSLSWIDLLFFAQSNPMMNRKSDSHKITTVAIFLEQTINFRMAPGP